MPTDIVPRRINASTVMLNGAETAPTKRSATAKLVTKMIEFVCNSLVFLIVKITKMFNKSANEPMVADIAIPSCMNTFLSKSQIISGAPGQKNFDREELTRKSSDILTFMSTYDQSSDQYDSVYPPIIRIKELEAYVIILYHFPFKGPLFPLK